MGGFGERRARRDVCICAVWLALTCALFCLGHRLANPKEYP